jgi:hypothetical protein
MNLANGHFPLTLLAAALLTGCLNLRSNDCLDGAVSLEGCPEVDSGGDGGADGRSVSSGPDLVPRSDRDPIAIEDALSNGPADAGSAVDRRNETDTGSGQTPPVDERPRIEPYRVAWSLPGPTTWSTAASGDAVYIAGSLLFEFDFEGTHLKSIGDEDIVIARLSPEGHVLWVKSFGTALADRAHELAVSPGGDVVIDGYFSGSQLKMGDIVLSSSDPGSHFFQARFSSTGEILWAALTKSPGSGMTFDADDNSIFGGSFGPLLHAFDRNGRMVRSTVEVNTAAITHLLADSQLNLFACGTFSATIRFPDTPNDLTASPHGDIFVAKVGRDGRVSWATGLGGNDEDSCASIALDGEGNLSLAGAFFDGTSGALNVIAKFDGAAGTRTWLKTFTKARFDGIAFDAQGDLAVVVGTYMSEMPDLGGGPLKGPSILARFASATGNFLSATSSEMHLTSIMRHQSGDLIVGSAESILRLTLP